MVNLLMKYFCDTSVLMSAYLELEQMIQEEDLQLIDIGKLETLAKAEDFIRQIH